MKYHSKPIFVESTEHFHKNFTIVRKIFDDFTVNVRQTLGGSYLNKILSFVA